jgi:NH3-dependent NAD+ synthetase
MQPSRFFESFRIFRRAFSASVLFHLRTIFSWEEDSWRGAGSGLSGGIDSALTAVIARDAVGAEHVIGVSMPSRYSSEGSETDARDLAERLGITFHRIPIEDMFSASLTSLDGIYQKPPSAELRPDQIDQDTLPAYEILDTILEAYIERGLDRARITGESHPREIVDRVIRMVDRSEYKRKQAAPGLRITAKAFGPGRRFPIVQRYRPEESP